MLRRFALAIHRPFAPPAPVIIPRDRVGARWTLETRRGHASGGARRPPPRRLARCGPAAHCRSLLWRRSTRQTNVAVRAVFGTGLNRPAAQGTGDCGHVSGYQPSRNAHTDNDVEPARLFIRDYGTSARPVSGPDRAGLTRCWSADRTRLLTRSAVNSAAVCSRAIATRGRRK